MSNSYLITLWGIGIGLFITIIGSALLLSFKIGGIHEKVISMEKILNTVIRTLNRVIDTISEMNVEIAEIRVKVDVLWHDHVSKSNSKRADPDNQRLQG